MDRCLANKNSHRDNYWIVHYIPIIDSWHQRRLLDWNDNPNSYRNSDLVNSCSIGTIVELLFCTSRLTRLHDESNYYFIFLTSNYSIYRIIIPHFTMGRIIIPHFATNVTPRRVIIRRIELLFRWSFCALPLTWLHDE